MPVSESQNSGVRFRDSGCVFRLSGYVPRIHRGVDRRLSEQQHFEVPDARDEHGDALDGAVVAVCVAVPHLAKHANFVTYVNVYQYVYIYIYIYI